MNELFGILIMGAFIILLIDLMPIAFIWSVNTLFGTGIAYSLWNIVATMVLLTILNAGSTT